MADTRDFVLGVLVGGAIGAAAALLYAPQAGTETRQLLKDKTGEVKDRTTQLAHQTRERASGLAQQAQTRATEVRETVKAKVGEISQTAQGAVERGKQIVTTQKEALASAVDAGRQAYTAKQSELQAQVEEDTELVDDIVPVGSTPATSV